MTSAASSSPGLRTLEIRVDPFWPMLLTVIFSLVFLGIGVSFGVAILSTLLGVVPKGKPWSGGDVAISFMGLVALLVGGALTRFSLQSLRTKVRLTLEPSQVRVDWIRGGGIVKMEAIPRADLVDVYIDKEASSGGGDVYALALGRQSGYLLLSTAHSGMAAKFYRDQRDAIARFLELPAREG